MKATAAVITISDKGSRGERKDTAGPAVRRLLEEAGYQVVHTDLVPDDYETIRKVLKECADEKGVWLTVTTGGTGFSPRDVTPEATLSVVEREARGIPEAMRAASLAITPKACLSRAAAGIRKGTLIVNLPGSEKAAVENLSAVLPALRHGLEVLRGVAGDCAQTGVPSGTVLAVCVSHRKGEQKHPVDEVRLEADHGILGDAHAGKWHRQVSLLAEESVDKLRDKVEIQLKPGDFAENILTRGIYLAVLPVGTRLKVGTALCEVTQIGKECHADCAIRKAAGDCVMPREGIFVRVLRSGTAKAGDVLTVVEHGENVDARP